MNGKHNEETIGGSGILFFDKKEKKENKLVVWFAACRWTGALY